ncbi:MAG: bL17 family ribosomal protein [Planctomycetaceae bacterium]
MRHRMRGRKLGRNASHRKALYRNMAASLIKSVAVDEDDPHKPRVPGRIVTTVAKAKELRPIVEKLVTMARKAIVHEDQAADHETDAERGSNEWKEWRQSDEWQKWNQAIAPAVALRRRAFAELRDPRAVEVLFDELAERFEDRPGGYTRVVKLATWRLGDAGPQAILEFVGERDRTKTKRRAPIVTEEEPETGHEEQAAAAPDEGQEQTGEPAPEEKSKG